MGQPKTLSANELRRVAGVWGKQYQTVQWHSTQLVVRHSLGINEYISLIRSIVADCSPKDGEVAYELFDFSVRLNVVLAYAFVELPEDIESAFYILYNSDLYDTVRKYANTAQIDAAIDGARKTLTRGGGSHGDA